MWGRRGILAVLAAVTFCAGAQQPTESFQLTATIEDGCLVSGSTIAANHDAGKIGDIDFGEHSALSTSQVTAQLVAIGGFYLTCTPGLTVTMSINGGLHAQGTDRYLAHNLSQQATPVVYQLYTDAGLSSMVGINTPVTLQRSTSDEIEVALYGSLQLTGDHEAGNYSDQLIVQIAW